MHVPSLSSTADYDDDDVFAWAVLMISATTDKGSHAQRWAQRMLEGMAISERRPWTGAEVCADSGQGLEQLLS
jgi:hypothetical protein